MMRTMIVLQTAAPPRKAKRSSGFEDELTIGSQGGTRSTSEDGHALDIVPSMQMNVLMQNAVPAIYSADPFDVGVSLFDSLGLLL